ncbi:MAG: hypothetical protein DWB42_04155 [Chloroflexi bacterium]|jgi:hypothetical protein|nr:hypothetical protein [Chloroflexota bacterium]MDL1882679.1 hypothetical protein [Anaerolineae bacterium CFX8]
MAIDYTIDYQCIPKQKLSTPGILERIKGRARAQAVIDLFRKNGDLRPATEIGFEMSRSTPAGEPETRVVMVKDLLEAAAELTPLADHCLGCPANNFGEPFGCYGLIEYPISGAAELWLLNRLPVPDEPLPWLLLRRAIEDANDDAAEVSALRAEGQPYFQERGVLARKLGEITVTSNQVFKMLFLMGSLKPAYAAVVLIFFGVIPRDLEANELMRLSASPEDAFERYPFQLHDAPDDDRSITQFKRFWRALYLAWGLNVRLLLDT